MVTSTAEGHECPLCHRICMAVEIEGNHFLERHERGNGEVCNGSLAPIGQAPQPPR